jgi:hypothetical protein
MEDSRLKNKSHPKNKSKEEHKKQRQTKKQKKKPNSKKGTRSKDKQERKPRETSGERVYKYGDPVPFRGAALPTPVKTFGSTTLSEDNVQYRDLNPVIQVCERIRLQDLVAGGVIFSRKGKTLNPHAARYFSNRYSEFIAKLVHTWTRYGLAVCQIQQDEVYLGWPLILDMRLLRIRMKVDYLGRRTYKVYPTFDSRFVDNMEMQDKELTDVIVLERRPPDVLCRCQSEFTSLLDDLQVFRMVQDIHVAAAKSAANPILVAQQMEQKTGEDSQSFGHPPPAATSVGEDPERNFRVIKVGSEEARIREQGRKYADYRNLGKPLHEDGDISYYSDIQSTVLKLQRNFVLNRQLPATDLTGYHEWRLQIEERISSVLGVPRQLYAMTGYTHAVDPVETSSTFRTHQKELKQAVTRVLYQVYYDIYADHHVEEALAKFDPKKQSTGELEEESSVEIHLPGLVDGTLIEKLYLQGLLKYESYVLFVANSESIPKSYFNMRPAISIKDLNGIKPEAEGAADVKTDSDGTTTTTTTKDTTKQSRTPEGGSSTTKTREITKTGKVEKERQAPLGAGGGKGKKRTRSSKGGGGDRSNKKSKKKKK